MTVITPATSSLLTYTNAGTAYARSAATSDPATDASTPAITANATTVTLSDEARALLAAQNTAKDFATVTADARTTLDQLYKDAGVTVPLAGGKPTIDLTTLDRRTLFAIASNSQKKFTSDEQTAASQELQRRFDVAIGPKIAASDLTGDYSAAYKAALDYLDGASAEEKASATWIQQRAALSQGYKVTQANPSALPTGIDNDLIADLVARTTTQPDTSNVADFGALANVVRTSLDQQYIAAKRAGTELVFDPQRKTGQLADLSGFDNRSLSAISLNQGNQFSPVEIRAAKAELDGRTRVSMLQAFQNSQKSGDPTAFSYNLLSQYAGMSAEERQAVNWGNDFRDQAIANFKSASTLMSMLSQLNTDQSGSSGLLSSGL
jgi:hypothetical protein